MEKYLFPVFWLLVYHNFIYNSSYFNLNSSWFLVKNIFWSKIFNLDYIMPSDAMFSQKCNENCFTWECGKHETFQLNLDKNMLFSAPPCIISRARTQKQSETGPFQCDGKDLYSLGSYINLKIKLFYLFCSFSFLIYISFYLQMAHLYIFYLIWNCFILNKSKIRNFNYEIHNIWNYFVHFQLIKKK